MFENEMLPPDHVVRELLVNQGITDYQVYNTLKEQRNEHTETTQEKQTAKNQWLIDTPERSYRLVLQDGKYVLQRTFRDQLIHELLAKKGITKYELFDVTDEGIMLPDEATGTCESCIGLVITVQEVYMFALDWTDGHYTLGENRGLWKALSPLEYKGSEQEIVRVQHRLSYHS